MAKKSPSQPNTQQKNFCLDIVNDVKQGQAYLNHYHCKSMAVAAVQANRLLQKPYIQAELARLRKKTEDDTVMGILERKQKLSEIARGTIPDFTDEAQGTIKVKKGMTNVGAVSEITTRTKFYKRDGEPVVITNLKLHNPVQAMDLLNKMDKVYGDATTVNIDNRKIEILVRWDGNRNENGHTPETPALPPG